jgi:hypothetical protein
VHRYTAAPSLGADLGENHVRHVLNIDQQHCVGPTSVGWTRHPLKKE